MHMYVHTCMIVLINGDYSQMYLKVYRLFVISCKFRDIKERERERKREIERERHTQTQRGNRVSHPYNQGDTT